MVNTGFIDELEIEVQAGNGGDGAVSLHHEKFRPRGGPDGGDGGRGGDVLLEADDSVEGFLHLARSGRIFRAENGKDGGKNKRAGASGKALILKVPVGTEVIDENKKIADLIVPGVRLTLASGGSGGRGNARFATSTDQAPRRAEKGKKTEPKKFLLSFKILADIGLIGYPNTGKSTLLAHLTSARPKIADYPFTTLNPNLGVMLSNGLSYTIVDMPALIEGSHKGSGIGNRFLRHLGRTRLLIHLLDVSQDPLTQFDLLNEELRLFDASLKERVQLVALNKIDLMDDKGRIDKIKGSLNSRGYEIVAISALEGTGLDELRERMIKYIFKL